jgi:hypothetical protein
MRQSGRWETTRLTQGYRGAGVRGPNDALRLDSDTVVSRLRDMTRNNPVLCGAVRNLSNAVLPQVLRVEPKKPHQ